MQRIIDDPTLVVEDMLRGFLRTHSDLVAPTDDPRVVRYVGAPVDGKVGIVTGGGSGHKPAFVGYVGRNMVDAVADGRDLLLAPAQMFYDAFKAADGGKGVACLYGNYAGDNMNVKMAIEMAEKKGIEVRTVVANDDVPSAPADRPTIDAAWPGRSSCGRSAGQGRAWAARLDEVIAEAQKAIDNTRSMGIGLSPCTIPEVGHPNFTIEDGQMEVGIGHHGEPGLEVAPIETAAQEWPGACATSSCRTCPSRPETRSSSWSAGSAAHP